jgi:hypothetical protein
MARIRTIKPEFFTSEDIVGLTPFARLLYIALWCESDRKGLMVWKPKTFKIRYLPADECDIQALCQELLDAGLVRLYGDGFAVIPSFSDHQHINPREAESVLPEPDAAATRRPRVPHASPRDSDAQGGKERKGKEDKTRDASGFDAFWAIYPNRKAKQDALKAWLKLQPDDALQTIILTAVSVQKESAAWRKDGGQYVPHASTWLNGSRWLDESAPTATGPTSVWEGAR